MFDWAMFKVPSVIAQSRRIGVFVEDVTLET
jgi:hypothetical protein